MDKGESRAPGEVGANRYRAFLDAWRTDVAPVHERTERSREFRTQYAQIGMRSLILVSAGALVALPAMARLIGVSVTGDIASFLLAEGFFLAALVLGLVALLLAYVTLDADVNRQKGERAAARARLVEAFFPDRAGEALEARSLQSAAAQRKFWKVGVALSWITVGLVTLALLALVAGGLVGGLLLRDAAAVS